MDWQLGPALFSDHAATGAASSLSGSSHYSGLALGEAHASDLAAWEDSPYSGSTLHAARYGDRRTDTFVPTDSLVRNAKVLSAHAVFGGTGAEQARPPSAENSLTWRSEGFLALIPGMPEDVAASAEASSCLLDSLISNIITTTNKPLLLLPLPVNHYYYYHYYY